MPTGLTLAGVRTLLRSYLDDRDADRFSDEDLLPLINEGQREIQKVIDHADEEFFSDCKKYAVVAATDAIEFTLPDNFKKANVVERVVPGGRPIPARWVRFARRHIEEDEAHEPIRNVLLATEQATRPRVYLRGNKIGVVKPTESYDLVMWYTYAIPDLVNDGDYSEIPSEYRNLVALTALRLAQGTDEGELPKDLREEYELQVVRLTNYIERRQKQAPREVVYDGE